MSTLSLDHLLDPGIALPVLVVRQGAIASRNEAARGLLDGEAGQSVEGLFETGSHAKLALAMASPPASCEVQARRGGKELLAVTVTVLPLETDGRLLLVAPTGAQYTEHMAQRLLATNDQLANLTRELSRRSADLEAARSRFESLADLREHFVSMLAHDVRGAIHAISLGTETIERAAGTSATKPLLAAVARIRRSTTRITDLVRAVLEAARTETGRMVLEAQPVSLPSIAQEAIDVYAPIAERAGVTVELVDRLGEVAVKGDRVRLGQVVGNLLENAFRHSSTGDVVTIELSASPDATRLEVRDQGPGVPPELRARLFERFVQGPGATGTLGLGLYVVRQLVELHGGRVRIEDAKPHGAVFVVELPRLCPDEQTTGRSPPTLNSL